MKLGQNLKKYREEKGIKKNELEKHLNKSKGVVTKWESGKSKPDANAIVEICKFLNITPNELLGWNYEYAEEYSLNYSEKSLITNCRQLNKEGQQVLSDFADILVSSKKYEKYNNIQTKNA